MAKILAITWYCQSYGTIFASVFAFAMLIRLRVTERNGDNDRYRCYPEELGLPYFFCVLGPIWSKATCKGPCMYAISASSRLLLQPGNPVEMHRYCIADTAASFPCELTKKWKIEYKGQEKKTPHSIKVGALLVEVLFPCSCFP